MACSSRTLWNSVCSPQRTSVTLQHLILRTVRASWKERPRIVTKNSSTGLRSTGQDPSAEMDSGFGVPRQLRYLLVSNPCRINLSVNTLSSAYENFVFSFCFPVRWCPTRDPLSFSLSQRPLHRPPPLLRRHPPLLRLRQPHRRPLLPPPRLRLPPPTQTMFVSSPKWDFRKTRRQPLCVLLWATPTSPWSFS